MKAVNPTLAIALLTIATSTPTSAPGQPRGEDRAAEAGRPDPGRFSGSLMFHQKGGRLTYQLSISGGRVTGGSQHFGDPSKPIAEIVGGWYDHRRGTLSLLIQGIDVPDDKWRAQAQHFRIDPANKKVILEHTLYGHGITATTEPLFGEHVLDHLNRNLLGDPE
jgi:hypothetical protein